MPHASSASVAASISLFGEESEDESEGGSNGEDDDSEVTAPQWSPISGADEEEMDDQQEIECDAEMV